MGAAVSEPSGLLERSDELATLTDAVESVVGGGGGRFVLVEGEAGVGKTALVRRFCDEQGQARVLWGGCDALFTPRPLGPFLDVARSVGGELERVCVGDPKPYQFAEVLMRELELPPPTVLVVEDVHWADEASLDVLRIVVRRIEALSVLIVATFRDDELDRRHPLRSLLGEVNAGARSLRIEVGPLSVGAVAALAEPQGDKVDADDLYRKTGGNPFFVTEVLAARNAEIPVTVRDAVLARAARLGQGAHEALEAVAVVVPHAELWLLDVVVPGSSVALEECVAAGMLHAVDGRVFFRHEIARRAVEDSIPLARRFELHRRALASLAARPDGLRDLARLAHHADAAGDAEAVFRYAPGAAERAASLGAHREAADHYARVLRFGELLPLAERAAFLERRGNECYLTDENPEAVAALREALDCYRELADTPAEARTLLTLATFLWCPGRVAESEAAAREAVVLLEQFEPGPQLVVAYRALESLGRDAADIDEAFAWAGRGLELAQKLGDPESLNVALLAVGDAEALAGIAGGLEKMEQILELTEEFDLDGVRGWLPLMIAQRTLHRREYAAADRWITSSLAYCGDHGLELWRQYALAYQARAALEQGNWPQAADSAEQVLLVRRASTTPAIIGLVVVGLLRARRGDPDPWTPIDEARELAEPSGELPRIGPAAAAQAETAWLEGRIDLIGPLTDSPYALALARRDSWLVGELAWWRRQAGIEEETPTDAAEPYALQLAGDWLGSATAWRLTGCPYETALALASSSEEEPLRQALAELQEMGALPAASIVSKRLRDLGVRGIPRGPRAATRDNPAGLTARELEVLELLTEGLQNIEIAGRLHLSVKTVGHHVAAILRKLDVSSRNAAAMAAVDQQLVAKDR